MDVGGFERALPRLFEDFPRSPHPRDRSFRRVLEAVPGLTSENNLALLNLAVSLLGEGEAYLEVGSLAGTSMIGAGWGNTAELIAIDDFSHPRATRAGLLANLRRFELGEAVVLEGDAFDLLPAGALAGRRVGVYYYDARHRYKPQLEALVLIEPFLAEQALVIIDDADWEDVDAAVRDYLAGQEKAMELYTIRGRDHGQPFWWEGVSVLAWSNR